MNKEKIQYLDWDSDFFNKKIGRILTENTDNLTQILEDAKSANYQLVYVFGSKDFFVAEEILTQFNGKLIDRRMLFEKNINKENEQILFVSEYNSDKLTTELEELACISGEYSRFKLDKNFEKDDFYRMYKIWIENSVKHQIADNVFVVKEQSIIKGMVTLKVGKEKGHIGLIAIAPDVQGKGYGKALISACENELLSKEIYKLEVPTQIDNQQACLFYEKCGFQIKEITNIYHFWL